MGYHFMRTIIPFDTVLLQKKSIASGNLWMLLEVGTCAEPRGYECGNRMHGTAGKKHLHLLPAAARVCQQPG